MFIEPIRIIKKYYEPDSITFNLLVGHGKMVAKKALEIANRLQGFNLDCRFIEEAALLHDIGIYKTFMPQLGCFGDKPYICHGYLGREILEKEGLPNHALVCERHIGMGLTLEDIIMNKLPLPQRDMMPISLEEKIICFADKFYSKKEGSLYTQKPVSQIKKMLSQYGNDKLSIFDEWLILFKEINYGEPLDEGL